MQLRCPNAGGNHRRRTSYRLVLAYDEKSGTTGYYTVTAVLRNLDPEIEYLRIEGEWLETTPEHPFYIEGKGWVAAGDLLPGDKVRKADGTSGTIETVEIVQRPKLMYNLTVEQAHTFFVGNQRWLVHNECRSLSAEEIALGVEYQNRAREIFESNTELLRTGPNSYREVLYTVKDDQATLLISGGAGSDVVRATLRGQGFNVLDDHSKEAITILATFPLERGKRFSFLKGGEYHTEVNAVAAGLSGNVWGVHSLDPCGRCRGFVQRYTALTHHRQAIFGPSYTYVADKGEFIWRER
jgi:Pretoxin HINT domain